MSAGLAAAEQVFVSYSFELFRHANQCRRDAWSSASSELPGGTADQPPIAGSADQQVAVGRCWLHRRLLKPGCGAGWLAGRLSCCQGKFGWAGGC